MRFKRRAPSTPRTTINFGGGRLVRVARPLDETCRVVAEALQAQTVFVLIAENGDKVAINPFTVELIQDGNDPRLDPK